MSLSGGKKLRAGLPPAVGFCYTMRMTASGNGSAKVFCALAAACAVVAWLSYLLGTTVRSFACQVATVVAASLSAASFLVSALLAFADRAGGTGGSRDGRAAPSGARSRWDAYLREMANASQALFGFLKELSGNARCREILGGLAGMERFDGGASSFATCSRTRSSARPSACRRSRR